MQFFDFGVAFLEFFSGVTCYDKKGNKISFFVSTECKMSNK